jgi:hypothetical protein
MAQIIKSHFRCSNMIAAYIFHIDAKPEPLNVLLLELVY